MSQPALPPEAVPQSSRGAQMAAAAHAGGAPIPSRSASLEVRSQQPEPALERLPVSQSLPVPASADVEQALVQRAEALLQLRDISSARLLLERAAEAGNPRALLLIAQSYDPDVLDGWRVRGIRGDIAKANEWYARARAAGVSGADQRPRTGR